MELCALPGVLPMVYQLDQQQDAQRHKDGVTELRPAAHHGSMNSDRATAADETGDWHPATEESLSLRSVVEALVVRGGSDGGGEASAPLDEGRHVGLRLLEASAARLNTAAQLETWHGELRAALGGAGVGWDGGDVVTDMNTATRERLLRRLNGRSSVVGPWATAELERQWEPSPTVTAGDAGIRRRPATLDLTQLSLAVVTCVYNHTSAT